MIGALNNTDLLQAYSLEPNEIIHSASRYAEWALNPDFNVPVRLGILDNLVFSNITALSGFTGDEGSLSTGEITARVPAIAVDVECNTAPVALYGSYQNCSASNQSYIMFDFACNTDICNSTINGTSPMLPWLSKGSRSEQCSWENSASRFVGSTYVDTDLGYQVLLVDWGDAIGYVANKTHMPFSLGHRYDLSTNSLPANIQKVLLEPGMLNVSLPER